MRRAVRCGPAAAARAACGAHSSRGVQSSCASSSSAAAPTGAGGAAAMGEARAAAMGAIACRRSSSAASLAHRGLRSDAPHAGSGLARTVLCSAPEESEDPRGSAGVGAADMAALRRRWAASLIWSVRVLDVERNGSNGSSPQPPAALSSARVLDAPQPPGAAVGVGNLLELADEADRAVRTDPPKPPAPLSRVLDAPQAPAPLSSAGLVAGAGSVAARSAAVPGRGAERGGAGGGGAGWAGHSCSVEAAEGRSRDAARASWRARGGDAAPAGGFARWSGCRQSGGGGAEGRRAACAAIICVKVLAAPPPASSARRGASRWRAAPRQTAGGSALPARGELQTTNKAGEQSGRRTAPERPADVRH